MGERLAQDRAAVGAPVGAVPMALQAAIQHFVALEVAAVVRSAKIRPGADGFADPHRAAPDRTRRAPAWIKRVRF